MDGDCRKSTRAHVHTVALLLVSDDEIWLTVSWCSKRKGEWNQFKVFLLCCHLANPDLLLLFL